MENTEPYYVSKLKEDFSRRQRRSSSYSLRAFARDLGVHHGALSEIIKGKRKLPLKISSPVMDKLGLGPKERTLFFESIHSAKSQLDKIKIDKSEDRFMLDESFFNVIAEWEHYAILTMFDLAGFTADAKEIARRLNINEMRVDVVVTNLLTCGLLSRTANGTLVKSHSKVRTTEDVSSLALAKSHQETLEIGMEKLEKVPVECRDFSSANWAIDPAKLPEAKIIIREFRQKMASLFKEGTKTEIYQLAIQFYPLTEIENTKENT
jgi:uncharacterized protein (TIGR02147 family)